MDKNIGLHRFSWTTFQISAFIGLIENIGLVDTFFIHYLLGFKFRISKLDRPACDNKIRVIYAMVTLFIILFDIIGKTELYKTKIKIKSRCCKKRSEEQNGDEQAVLSPQRRPVDQHSYIWHH